MDDQPDLNFDIDALFDHLVNNLDHNVDDEQEWSFTLRSDDLQALNQVAGELEDDFIVQLQETVEEIDINGDVSFGNPILIVVRRSALGVDEVKQIAAQIEQIANERGLTYEGVDCYDPIDAEELYGWLEPEDAGWRLRHMTDCGLAVDADLPWAFLVATQSLGAMTTIAESLAADGFDDRDDFDEPDEEGNFGTCVFVAGRNNEFELLELADKISSVAESNGGSLVGIQFYTREDLAEVFGAEDDV